MLDVSVTGVIGLITPPCDERLKDGENSPDSWLQLGQKPVIYVGSILLWPTAT